jgi:hypothetical protein
MRTYLAAVFLAILSSACGGVLQSNSIPTGASYSLSTTYISKIACTWSATVGGTSYAFSYGNTVYSSTQKFLSCSAGASSSTLSASTSYAYPASQASGSQCAVLLDIDGGTTGVWNFTVSGSTVTATYTNAASPNNGATTSKSNCAF